MKTILKAHNISKTFKRGDINLDILKNIDLEIYKGQLTFIVGPSGSGKSTLLQLLGGLDTPNSGYIEVMGDKLNEMNDKGLSQFRRRHLGYVFQFFNLLNNLNALENIVLPLILDGQDSKESENKARILLGDLGLSDKSGNYSHQLSGGQMQRIAIARSLIADPHVVLADEPTGNLDSQSAKDIIELFSRLAREKGHTIVMVTHDLSLIPYGDRVIHIKDGEIVKDEILNQKN